MTYRIPNADSKLVVFESTGTVAFTVGEGSAVSTRRTTVLEVWKWYETALDIASLPTIDAHLGR